MRAAPTQRIVIARAARALHRLLRLLHEHSLRDSTLGLLGIKPYPWLLTGVPTDTGLRAMMVRVSRAEEYMLAYLDGTLRFSPLVACQAMQHLVDDMSSSWSLPAQRLAVSLGFTLPKSASNGRVTMLDVDVVAVHQQIDRLMENPRIVWEPRAGLPGWKTGRVDGRPVVYMDVGEKRCELRWADRDQTQSGWLTRHGSEEAAKLAAEERVAAMEGRPGVDRRCK